MTRLLFSSWHFYLDPSNGASISARELLLELSRRGWDVKTFCGATTDFDRTVEIESILASRGIAPKKRLDVPSGAAPFVATSFRDSGIDSVVFQPRDGSTIPTRAVGEAFLQLFAETLKKTKPEIVLTYGGYWFGGKSLEIARNFGAKTVVLLQNFAYEDAKYFDNADLVLVPSLFAADVYQQRLGVEVATAPPPIDWDAVRPHKTKKECEESEKKHVLFVNPSPNKGVYVFAKIAEEMGKIRPEIPFLIVEGARGIEGLVETGLSRRGFYNLSLMKNTTNPRDFYRLAKITLVPSLFLESFGRVAAESAIAGVPVVASDRGAIPETMGDAAILLSVPAKYTPETRLLPTTEEIKPWLDAILSLWDDQNFYQEMQNRGRKRAENWRLSNVVDLYETRLREIF